MTYEIPTDIRDRVKARLDEGTYQSEAEVLRDAMDALDQLEQDKLIRWNTRNKLAVQQSEQGLSKPLDDQNVLTRLRERLAQEGILVRSRVLFGRRCRIGPGRHSFLYRLR